MMAGLLLYRARTSDCGPCPLKARCCPKAPERKIPRSIYEDARDVARALAGTKRSSNRATIANGSRCCSPTSSAFSSWVAFGFVARAALRTSSRWPPLHRTYAGSLEPTRPTTTNTSRCVCSVAVAGVRPQRQSRLPMQHAATSTSKNRVSLFAIMIADVCNKIGYEPTHEPAMTAFRESWQKE